MKRLLSILCGVYLFMLVLMPHLHLFLGHHGTDSTPASSCCSHAHPTDADEQPTEENRSHEDCFLCQALVPYTDAHELSTVCTVVFTLNTVPLAPTVFHSTLPEIRTQARAPPFFSV